MPSPIPTDTAIPLPTITPSPTAIFRLRLDAVFSPAGDVPFGQRAYSPDGKMYASEAEPLNNGKIGLYQQETGKLLRMIDADQPQNHLKGLAWSPDSTRLAVMYHFGSGGAILIFKAQTGNEVQVISIPDFYHFMVFAPDGTHIIVSTADTNDSAETIDLSSPSATCLTSPASPPSGPADRFQKGMSYTSWSRGEYCSEASDQSLQDLAATGTEWISLLVTGYQDNIASTAIDWNSSHTPSDSDLIHAISTAHRLGMRVMLKPHVDLIHDPAHWRGQIGESFSNEEQWKAWFASYQNGILEYADLAQAQGVEQLCIGTELSAVSIRDQDWRNLAQQVRQRFKGTIVYASNQGEERNVGWWDAVDFIGVDAYYALATKPNPGVFDLKLAWVQEGYVDLLQQLSSRYGKPVLFTEIGYRSADGATESPWDYARTAPVNLQEQANAYQAAIETFKDKPWFAGFYWWNWNASPNQGGLTDAGLSPFGKPAEQILSSFYHTAMP